VMGSLEVGPNDLETIFYVINGNSGSEVGYKQFVDKLYQFRTSGMYMLLESTKMEVSTQIDELSRQVGVQATLLFEHSTLLKSINRKLDNVHSCRGGSADANAMAKGSPKDSHTLAYRRPMTSLVIDADLILRDEIEEPPPIRTDGPSSLTEYDVPCLALSLSTNPMADDLQDARVLGADVLRNPGDVKGPPTRTEEPPRMIEQGFTSLASSFLSSPLSAQFQNAQEVFLAADFPRNPCDVERHPGYSPSCNGASHANEFTPTHSAMPTLLSCSPSEVEWDRQHEKQADSIAMTKTASEDSHDVRMTGAKDMATDDNVSRALARQCI